jgi:predicted metal-dependent TIM-barrel fold hydrolase
LIIDALLNHPQIDPGKVIIDHVEEHTAPLVLEKGFWAGMTLYPESKVTPNRAIDMLELYGCDRVWMNSACDWGVSDPLSVPKAALEMRRRGYDDAFIDRIVYLNPVGFMGQSPRFRLK